MKRFFRDLSIGAKTSAATAVLLLCLIGLSADALLVIFTGRSELQSLSSRHLAKQEMVLAIADSAINTHVNVFRYVAWSAGGVNRTTLDSLAKEIDAGVRRVRTSIALLESRTDLRPSERSALLKAAAKWERYATAAADTVEISTDDPALGTTMLGGTDDDFKKVADDLQTIVDFANRDMRAATQELITQADKSISVIALGALIAVLLGAAVTFVVARSLIRPIQDVTKAMRAIAAGRDHIDLSSTDRRDEIGQMVNAISIFRDKLEQDNRLLAERERELLEQKRELLVQNTRFDAALNNMSQGLVMFDREGRLIVCNERFGQLYGLPRELMKPGTTQREILAHRIASGLYDPSQTISDILLAHGGPQNKDTVIELRDGRIIALSKRTMADGGWVATHEDVTERRRSELRIAYLARHDGLTGLPNRPQLREQMEAALAFAREGGKFAVLFIDLDHFKEVNDTLGHPSGDELLKQVSERLRQSISETDVLARLGGDEFAVLQIAVRDRDEIASLAARIISVVGEPYDIDGHEIIIGASIGIAVAPDDGSDADQLLKNADMALYHAKGDGRGTYRFFEAEMERRLQARRKLEIELRKAVAEREFELHYQPIVSLTTNRVIAFEALIRWHHPARGLVMPRDFISVAEETGLICEIGEWALRQACLQAATWPRDIGVAVNLSSSQFRKTLVPAVVQALAASGLQPSRLELEVTESALLQNNETTRSMLRQLQKLGVRISLDDFGTGYSSLSYLHSFPFDRIKIDRSFVSGLETRPDCQAIVKAVLGLGATLGMRTTAEGVETREQLERLRADGCTEAQGYLFSPPRPADELAKLIAVIDGRLAA